MNIATGAGTPGCALPTIAGSTEIECDNTTGTIWNQLPNGATAGSLEFGPDGNLYAGGDTNDGGNIYRITPPFNGPAVPVGASGFAQVTGLTLCDPATPTEESSWGKIKAMYRWKLTQLPTH